MPQNIPLVPHPREIWVWQWMHFLITREMKEQAVWGVASPFPRFLSPVKTAMENEESLLPVRNSIKLAERGNGWLSSFHVLSCLSDRRESARIEETIWSSLRERSEVKALRMNDKRLFRHACLGLEEKILSCYSRPAASIVATQKIVISSADYFLSFWSSVAGTRLILN